MHVGAGLIQFVYGLHSSLTADLIFHKVLFLRWFLRAFKPPAGSFGPETNPFLSLVAFLAYEGGEGHMQPLAS